MIRVVAAVLALALCAAVQPLLSGPQTGTVREIKVRMSIGAAAPESLRFLSFRPDTARMEVLARKTLPGTLQRERNPELSEDLVVIVAVNIRGEETYRVSRPDPRLLRAETADDTGLLSSTRLYRENVEFWVALPDDPDLDKILFFHPEWTGAVFNLVPVGEVRLR